MLKPLFKKVRLVFMVYMKGVDQGQGLALQTEKVTLLLTTLYNMLLGCDTLFETTVVEEELDGEDFGSDSSLIVRFTMLIFLAHLSTKCSE